MAANYLRLSVTDRCNLRCSYCAPAAVWPHADRSEVLSYEQIALVVEVAASLGVSKVRVTGGEPLVRRDVGRLLAALSRIPGLRERCLTTNGTLLREHVPDLVAAGFDRVNVSLDTLDPARSRDLCGAPVLVEVVAGIDDALAAGIRPKLNAVVWPGFDVADAVRLVRFAHARALDLRFIEAMRVSGGGGAGSRRMDEVVTALDAAFALAPDGREGMARMFRVAGGEARVGLITPSHAGFCDGCRKLRVSSTGRLRTCLFGRAGVDLRPAAVAGDRERLAALLGAALATKAAGRGREGAVVASMPGIGG
ncbi:MAG: radical SAM protein [Deltaproteobacteria bacterium]|nr:radical SAM protein [Deltaproteobacteria bacterium]